tara:strand:+ start:29729 stop:30145 length:417 start_codon:yes stop_codon:yes gene_type:complete
MFGFFKRGVNVNLKKTTGQCMELWHDLNGYQRHLVGQHILNITKHLNENCSNGKEAFIELKDFKYEVMRKHRLKNHMHPDFMKIQILMDVLLTAEIDDIESVAYTRQMFQLILVESLADYEIRQVSENLSKFGVEALI